MSDSELTELAGPNGGDQLSAEARVLLGRVGRWTARSWAVRADGRTRSDVVFALVRRLADITANAEGEPRRDVPRLDDGVLPDQLTVVTHDLLRTGSPVAYRDGLAAVRATHTTLFG
ncbi:MAG TPA: hypothetical protein VFX70_06880 [Mycobacteriales bacterium]|nr:hypothetical protein [Mycobacteriales bacterium]